ncbi:MAG: PLD nuclease N-terminal domain-containing protein [Anaerolineae bacterium]
MDLQTLLPLLIPLIIIQLALQISALVDIWRHKGAKSNTPVWVVVVILFQIFGAVAYFLLGRKESEA